MLPLTLFLPGEGRIIPLIVYHVTTSVRNRVKLNINILNDFIMFLAIFLMCFCISVAGEILHRSGWRTIPLHSRLPEKQEVGFARKLSRNQEVAHRSGLLRIAKVRSSFKWHNFQGLFRMIP